MEENQEGFLYPKININLCINCGKCKSACANNRDFEFRNPLFYMGWHKDLDVLKNSSSGGAFTSLAQYVLDKNGIVFGAWFDASNKRVLHIGIEKIGDLPKIRLSKYYQGEMRDAYIAVKNALPNRWVLFSGTSCQVAGLYSFLGKDYDKLITVDVLCHGITSKKVIDAYLRSKERKYHKKIIDFRFRLKPEDSDWMSGGGLE